jgi:hypothetical protein
MAITIGNYSFDGPYSSISSLEDRSGVYAIHCRVESKYYLVDVGESAKVKTRVENHDRADCWRRNCKGQLTVSVLYTENKQQAGRKEIEQELRQLYNPPCGAR